MNVALTVTEYARDPVAPTASVAVIVKLNVPAALDVPVIAPVAAFRDKPVGNDPAVTANVEAPVPPLDVSVCEYATPCVVAGSDAGFTVSGAATTTVYARAPVALSVSVAVIVKLKVPAVVVVPVMAPVDVFSDRPVGKAPAETE